MFSLAGVPPTVGFYGKLAVIQVLVSAGQIGLAVFAVLASLVGAFYYLRVVKSMYFDQPVAQQMPLPAIAQSSMVVLSCSGFAVLVLGVMPGPLFELCSATINKMLGV
jgi:NADH-quinone oxidoreductase subunit N